MKKILIRIEGVSPLLCSNYVPEEDGKKAGHRPGQTGDYGTPLEQAEKRLYRGVDGSLIIPSDNLFACICGGGKFHKVNKRQVTTQKSSILYGCAEIEEIAIGLEHKQPWKVFSKPGRVPPKTGPRILIHRPMFDDWSLECNMILDNEIIGAQFMREIIDDAGKRIGLGDWRPDLNGRYGKFVVTKWIIQEFEEN